MRSIHALACSIDRYSDRSVALKAQVSQTCVPCMLTMRTTCPARSRTARPWRAGTVYGWRGTGTPSGEIGDPSVAFTPAGSPLSWQQASA